MTDILSLCTLRFQNGEAGKETEEDKDANKSEISVVFEICPVTVFCITLGFISFPEQHEKAIYACINRQILAILTFQTTLGDD